MMKNVFQSSPDTHAKWLEIVAAIILAIASLLTAWSSYQASKWSRIQALQSAGGIARLLESTRLSALGGTDSLIDVVTFTNWLEAVSTKSQSLAIFIAAVFGKNSSRHLRLGLS